MKLTSNTTDNPQNKRTIQQTQLNEALIKLRDEIISLEARGEAIYDLLDEKRVKLNSDQRNTEYQKLTHETKALKELWRHEPTWTRRQQIETKEVLGVSNNNNLALISFYHSTYNLLIGFFWIRRLFFLRALPNSGGRAFRFQVLRVIIFLSLMVLKGTSNNR